MRILITILSVFCLQTGWLFAEGLDRIAVKASNVSLTATKSIVTSGSKLNGYIERVDISFANNTSVVDIVLFGSNAFTGVNTTFLTLYSVATNAAYYPRFNGQTYLGATGFTNDAQRYALFDETIYQTVTNAAYSNQNVIATIFYEHK